jgi:3'-phosphoadenosine 5'-phosphosulfate sulfotransferase (PAPS reductase)/FAD synthetase
MITTALHFSGGKDSLACLYMYRHRWKDMYVVWANTGSLYPEMQAYMDKWKAILPHFVEVKTDQPKQIAENGWPVDVLPVNNMPLGRVISGSDGPLMQPYTSCCATNIWFPLHEATLKLGVTEVIKGQRVEDGFKSLARNGTEFQGLTYIMPIEDWTTDEVFAYLNMMEVELPPGYTDGEKTGRDCWDCTAFLADNQRRIANLPEDRKNEIKRRLGIIKKSIDDQWNWVD